MLSSNLSLQPTQAGCTDPSAEFKRKRLVPHRTRACFVGSIALVTGTFLGSAFSAGAVLSVVQPGGAKVACANNDGPAIELEFKIAEALPLAPGLAGPAAADRILRVRANGTEFDIKSRPEWKIGNPDTSGGLLAWVCPVDGYMCNHATMGVVSFHIASDNSISGEWSLLLNSGHRVVGKFGTSAIAPKAHRCG